MLFIYIARFFGRLFHYILLDCYKLTYLFYFFMFFILFYFDMSNVLEQKYG